MKIEVCFMFPQTKSLRKFFLRGCTKTQNEGILRFGMEILSDVVVYIKRKVYRLVFKYMTKKSINYK